VGASDVVVLCDHAPYYPPIVGDPTLLYRPSGPGTALSRDERHVTSARVAVATAPRSALVRGYDFRRPRLELRSEARAAESPDASGRAAGRAAVDLYHFGGVGDESPPDVELATAELERARRGSLTLRATSRCFRLTPGRTFTLGDAPTAAASGPWVVTRVTHRLDPSSADAPYECRVSAEPAERTLRPPRRARRVAPSSETAIVVGPPGQEVHVDELGRVRVQFLWQLDGAWDGRASAWLRTAQAWAGTGFGSQFLPRVGMEVLVHYLGGDVDRPVIAGALYNATHPPPFPVSTSAVKSGLRTLSSPGGAGYSELSFEDRAGAELVQLVAQRDRATLVRHDHRERVEHDQASEVAHDRTARVGRDDVVEVGRHHEVRVAGSETGASMRAGSIQQSTGGASMGMTRDVRLSAAGDMSLGAGGTLSLGGALVTITSRGDVLIEASGNIGLRAGGDVRIEAGGDVSLEGSEIIERGSAIREN
jgi:type VI secretion system secreted protein VgrG